MHLINMNTLNNSKYEHIKIIYILLGSNVTKNTYKKYTY